MSASLVFRPIKPQEILPVDVIACQVRRELHALFGEYPVQILQKDRPAIATLAAIHEGRENPWQSLMDLLDRYPSGVELWEEQ